MTTIQHVTIADVEANYQDLYKYYAEEWKCETDPGEIEDVILCTGLDGHNEVTIIITLKDDGIIAIARMRGEPRIKFDFSGYRSIDHFIRAMQKDLLHDKTEWVSTLHTKSGR